MTKATTAQEAIVDCYRQGDVLIIPAAIPDGAKLANRQRGRIVLAEGEVTGHAHVITAPAADAVELTTEENLRFLRIMAAVDVTHEEHGTVRLPAGDYRIIVQEEWSDQMEPVRVLD